MRKINIIFGLIVLVTAIVPISEGNAMTKTQQFFTDLNKETMHLVDEYYAEDIEFHDPMVNIDNRKDLKDYYAGVYSGPQEVSFEYLSEVEQGNEVVLMWKMTFVNKKFNKGRPVYVDGSSHIKFNEEGKAFYHRDYFDMGEMIYKHVPILRGMVKFVNKKLAQSHAKH